MNSKQLCPTCPTGVGQGFPYASKTNCTLSHCPTLLRGGTVGQDSRAAASGTCHRTNAGQGTLKALAKAFLSVPTKNDSAGHVAGQGTEQVFNKSNTPRLPVSSALVDTCNFANPPTPAQIDHARSLLVHCCQAGRKLHAWNCTRCANEPSCTAWRHISAAEMRFQRRAAGKTLSAEIAETILMEGRNE